MRTRKFYIALILGFYLLFNVAQAQTAQEFTAESHIKANTPESADIDTFMVRDLEAYFADLIGKIVKVKYEFLRDGPTQTGTAYPKFYLWVRLTNKNKPVQEGAVRVAAIEKKRFEVTHFMSATEIIKNPECVYGVFPRPVCDKIKAKIK